MKKKRGKKLMIFLYIFLALVILMIGQMIFTNMRTPKNLGVHDGLLAQVPKSPNAVSSQSDNPDYHVEPFPFKEDLESTKLAVINAIESYGNADIIVNEPNYIHAVFTTSKMSFHDDVEFYFNEAGSIVAYRTASWVGYSDMGLNRARYTSLFEYYTNH
ncbi:MAG: DUF1499 domain-containing protein [Vallitaleaceae bacterium]|jgi:uncharacterized protein (DUF1499 family)|nr:DUF1499 domain-containing protein [Vallitaleaceae bacterium]